MISTLASSTRTITLPKYAVGGLGLGLKQNFAKNYPLQGNMYVDFFSTRSPITMTFDVITRQEYEDIKSLFFDQIQNEEFLDFTDTDLGLSNFSVFLNLPAETNLKWNREATQGLVILLEPENADSI